MALQGRHRYIISKLSAAYGFDEDASEQMVKSAPVLESINNFFKGTGPSRIIFFISPRVDEHGFETGTFEFVVSDGGTNIPLAPKAVFFLKTVKREDNDEVRTSAAIDPTSSTDSALIWCDRSAA